MNVGGNGGDREGKGRIKSGRQGHENTTYIHYRFIMTRSNHLIYSICFWEKGNGAGGL